MAAALGVNCHFSADLVPREYHHSADCVAYAIERIKFLCGHLFDYVRDAALSRERRNHRVARQEEFTNFRAVMQICAGIGVIEVKNRSTRQGFAPKKLVIAA
jgi:hypothetical protein